MLLHSELSELNFLCYQGLSGSCAACSKERALLVENAKSFFGVRMAETAFESPPPVWRAINTAVASRASGGKKSYINSSTNQSHTWWLVQHVFVSQNIRECRSWTDHALCGTRSSAAFKGGSTCQVVTSGDIRWWCQNSTLEIGATAADCSVDSLCRTNLLSSSEPNSLWHFEDHWKILGTFAKLKSPLMG